MRSKASARVESYGTIDELNAFVGVAKSQIWEEKVLKQLSRDKLVDEYHVTFWTRGQYPAAPPRKQIKEAPFGASFCTAACEERPYLMWSFSNFLFLAPV